MSKNFKANFTKFDVFHLKRRMKKRMFLFFFFERRRELQRKDRGCSAAKSKHRKPAHTGAEKKILSPDSWSCGRPAVNYWHICVHICCSRWKGNVNALPTNAKVTKRSVTPKRTKTWSRKRRTRTQPVHGVFYSRKHFGGNRKHEHFTKNFHP